MKSGLPKYGSILILLLGFSSLYTNVSGWDLKSSWEAALQTKLLKDRVIVRPAYFNKTVTVQLRLSPTYLQEINTAQQLFSIVATLVLYWEDDSLRWDPAEYENATFIYLPAARLWKPNFGILNSASNNVLDESETHKYQIRAEYTGHLGWLISKSFTTMCEMNVVLFPFDAQTCSLNITGWGADASSENYTGVEMDTTYLLINNDWELIGRRINSQYSQLESFVEFRFTFRRKPDFYLVTMIIPLIILSFLGLLVFALPAESGEKISLAITCLLSFSVMQASVTETLPSGFSGMPHVVKMLLFLMFFNALSVAMAILTARIAGPPYHKMPEWLEKLLIRSQKVELSENDGSKTTVAGRLQMIDLADDEKLSKSENGSSVKDTDPDEVERIIRNCLAHSANMEEKWKLLADLVNRIFFVMFSVALVAMVLVIAITWTL